MHRLYFFMMLAFSRMVTGIINAFRETRKPGDWRKHRDEYDD